jgi:hypothetical protein
MTDTGQKPGSDEALALGCLCPVIDNGHGRGYMGQPGIYVMRDDCPLHGFTPPAGSERAEASVDTNPPDEDSRND